MHQCHPSRLSSSVRCLICGQGFLIYAEHGVEAGNNINLRLIQHVLRTHHLQSTSPAAHPDTTFHIPNWSGAQPLLASASLSDLLDAAP